MSNDRLPYKNETIKKFYAENNIKQMFSSPYHPQNNGVVKVAHKEIRKQVIISHSKISR